MPRGNPLDLTDRKFSRLRVIERAGSDARKQYLWRCKCDCGGEVITTTGCLRSGNTKSCGCLRRETTAHTARTRRQRAKTDWTKRTEKFCPDCKEVLLVSEFGKNPTTYDKLTAYCKVHHSERSRLNRAKNHGSGKAYWLKYVHGMTIEHYEHMLEEQGHVCAICRKYPRDNLKNPWHVDHDHKTDKIRGILCHHCNTALGGFRDDIEILEKAIKYLREHS